MSEIKRLQTRIALKYDTYANWTDEAKGANLVLLKGEIGFCELPTGNTEATTAPTVLFKVGDGKKTFSQLKWASALAADVYDWAKAERAEFDAESGKIVFKDANGNKVATAKEIDLSSLATKVALKEATDDIADQKEAIAVHATRLTDIEATLGLGNTGDGSSVAERLEELELIVEEVTGDSETKGSIAFAESSAKAYADEQIETAVQTVTGAYEEFVGDAIDAATDTIAEKDAAQDELIQANADAIAQEASDRADADALINAKFGAEYGEGSTVKDAIDAAKSGAEATAAGALAEAKTEIKGVTDKLAEDLAKETKAREDADKILTEDVAKIKVFFDNADADGEDTEGGKTLYDALDTLKEIQDFINGEATAADELLESVGNNADAIAELQATVDGAEGKEGLVAKVAANTEAISGVDERVIDLETLTAGDWANKTIKARVEEVSERAEKGISDAATAQGAAEAAQSDATSALNAIGNAESGIVKDVADVTATANTNKEDIADIYERVVDLETLTAGDWEGKTIKATVEAAASLAQTGVDNAATAQGAADAAQAAADAAQEDATEALEILGNEEEGLVADVNKNTEDIAKIKTDYVQFADFLIIDCGNAVLREGEPVVE